MKSSIQSVWSILKEKERKSATKLFFVSCVSSLIEMVGVASIFPMMMVLSNPSVVRENKFLNASYEFFSFESESNYLIILGFVTFALILLSNFFKGYTAYNVLKFSYNVNHTLSSRLIKKYLGRSYQWFLMQSSSNLSKTMLAEVNQVISKAVMPLVQICTQFVTVIVLMTLLFFVDLELAVTVLLVLGGVYFSIFSLIKKKLRLLGRDRMKANRYRFQVTQDALNGIKDIRIKNAEHIFVKNYVDASRDYIDSEVRNQSYALIPRYLIEAIGIGGILLLALYLFSEKGGVESVIPVLTLYAVAGYRLLPSLQSIYQSFSHFSYAEEVIKVIKKDLLDIDGEDVGIESGTIKSLGFKSDIKLENVFFKYPGKSSDALSSVNITIKKNQSIGFVGTTGSGKSTTIDILMGLLMPNKGIVSIDDVRLNRTNFRSWQKNIGYVPQNIFLSNDTIANNIAFGLDKDKIDNDAVVQAAKIANLHDFVTAELENGYETVVGDRGIRLSGGQRQRIGIARALYHDPEILLFDEATSSLDNLTELAVIEAIEKLEGKKTIITVAHRLSTVRKCDCIYVMEQGAIKANGNFAELVNDSKIFNELVRKSGDLK